MRRWRRPGLKTVILTDSSKVALDARCPDPAAATLRSKLAAFAARAEINGVVVDVAGDARVSALKQQAANNPACPFAKNLVAEEIKGIVDSYRANPLQYVVIVGNDDAIPFFRSPDQSVLGQESGYVPPVQSNSAVRGEPAPRLRAEPGRVRLEDHASRCRGTTFRCRGSRSAAWSRPRPRSPG